MGTSRDVLFLFMCVFNPLNAELVSAQTCGTGGIVTSAKGDDGKVISVSIDGSEMWRTPIWVIDRSDPPLSVKRAAQIASAWAARKYPTKTTEVDSIMLRSLPCTDGSDRWYYFFYFYSVSEKRRTHELGNWLVVLMDGSVIEPRFDAS